MSESVQTAKAPLKPIRAEVIPKEELCFNCQKKARKIRRRIYIYADCPVTGKRIPVRLHPKPRLYGYCSCGNHWKRNIPKSAVREVL